MIEPAKHVHPTYRSSAGKALPSVTQILGIVAKPYLVPWANKLGKQGIDSDVLLKRSASIGTLAHALVQGYLNNEEVSVEGFPVTHVEAAKNALASFMKWKHAETHSVRPILLEQEMTSETYGFGGTLDAVLKVDGMTYIVDFKTGRSIHKEYMAQLAAYKLLYDEYIIKLAGHGVVLDPIDYCMILKLGTGPKPTYSTAFLGDDYELYKDYFLDALELHTAAANVEMAGLAVTHVE